MATRIQLRRDTQANWNSYDPVLAEGELGLNLDTGQIKIGDGSSTWSALQYNPFALNLSDLTDVVTASTAAGDFLRWDGSNWINDAVNLSTDTIGDYVEQIIGGTGVTVSGSGGEGSSASISIGQNVATTSSVTFAAVTAPLIGNADTASQLETARTIFLTGDVTGSVSFDGSQNASISTTIEPNSVSLGTDTTGNYMENVAAGTGVSVSHTPGEGSTASISIGQDVGTSSSVTFAAVTAPVIGNADTASALKNSRIISLSGDVSGSVSFNGSTNVDIAATIQPNSVALGTDTTGNFMSDVSAGTGVTVSHTPGESSTASISIGQDVATNASVQFAKLTTTGDVIIGGDLTVNGTTTTLNTETLAVEDNIVLLNSNTTGSPSANAGIEVERGDSANVVLRWNESTDSWEVTEDGSTYKNIAVGQDVETSSSVTFAAVTASTFTGSLVGNADTASQLATARTIALSGDVTGSVSFNGSGSVDIATTIQPNSIALGTDTTGNFMTDVAAGTGIAITHTPGEGSTASIALNAWLNDLGDVVIVGSPEKFQTLGYDGAGWVNSYAPVVSYVRNVEATTLTVGTVVYLFGGTGDHASVKRADNSSDTTSSKTVGIVGANIAASENGPVVTRGYVSGMDLSAYSAGDVLWLGENGAFTTTKPTTPKHLVFIGVVVRATNNGIIYVATQNGYELEELHDVKISSPQNNDFLKYNSASAIWVNDPINLGTDTVGNYMTDVVAGTGVTITHTPGEGSSASVAIGQEVATTSSVTFAQVTAPLVGNVTGNADTASQLYTPRIISLTGDVTGSVSFSGSANAEISTAIQPNSVALGTDTTGNYVNNVVSGTGVTVSHTPGEGSTASISIGQPVATSSSVTFAAVTAPLIGNANTASTLQNARTISLSGDVSGSVSFNGSTNVDIAATIQPNSVALGTDTTGNYVNDVVAGTGVTVSHTPGEGSSASISIGQAVATSSSVTFAAVTAPLIGNANTASTLQNARTISLSGDVSGSVSFNGSTNVDITTTVQPNSVALGSDTTGNYMSDAVGGTGVTVTHTPGEGSSASIAIGQDVATNASVSFAQVSTTGDVTVGGNLTVNGTTTTLNTETLAVEDNIVLLNSNVTGAPSTNAGIEVERGDSANVVLRWNESTDSWEVTEDGSVYKNIAVGQDVETSSSVTFADVKSNSASVSGGLTVNGLLDATSQIHVGSPLSPAYDADMYMNNGAFNVVSGSAAGINIQTGGTPWLTMYSGGRVTTGNTPEVHFTGASVVSATSAAVSASTVTASTFTGALIGNADTASQLATARTIALSGDVTGSVSFNGSGSVDIATTIQPNSVALGTDTTGNYVNNVVAGTGVTVTHTPGEGSSASIAIGQPVATSSSVTFAAVTAPLIGNADTASTLQNARTISLSGDVSGSVSFNGSTNVDIAATIQPNSVALGTDTTGNYVNNVVAGTGVTVTHTPGEGSSASIAIGQAVGTSSSVTFAQVTAPLVGNADTASRLQTARTISLSGDVSGSVSFNGSTNVDIAATIQPNSVALGTDTTGNYVADVVAGTNISITHTPGEGSSASVAVVGNPTFSGTASAADFRSSTFLVQPNGYVGWLSPADAYGRIYWSPSTTRTIYLPDVSGSIVTTGDTGTVTSTMIANGTITNSDISEAANIGLLKLQNAGVGGQLIVTDASGVPTYQTITGDISVNASGVASIQANSVALGTDTTGNYVASLVAGTGVTLSNNSGESATPTIAIGQAVATSSSVTFAQVTASVVSISVAPSSATDAATKAYVDQVTAGINWHESVAYATAAALPNSPSYANGSADQSSGTGIGATLTATTYGRLQIDGGNTITGQRVLVKNQSNAIHNGIYDVTEQGSASVYWVLTRAGDSDNSIAEQVKTGDAAYVLNGTVNATQGFLINSTGSLSGNTIQIGTDEITWTQFTGTATFVAGAGLSTSGNTINIGTESSSRIVVNADTLDLATVSQTNTTGTAGTSFVQSHTVDSYGRVTGTVTADVQDASTSAKGIASFNSGQFSVTSGSVSIKSGGITSTEIANGTIVNSDVSETAGIALMKLQYGTSGQMIVAASDGMPTWQTITGDISVNASGVATIAANSVALGTDTTGNYVASLVAGSGISLANNTGESATPTISNTGVLSINGSTGVITGVVTTSDSGTVTSTMIADGTIVNSDISTSAAIAHSKLANGTEGQVLLGTTITGAITATTLSGDVTINGAGVTAISSGVIVNADINASAAIDKTKISGTAITAADSGTVTSTMIADGTIVNGDINSAAAIAHSKLANATPGQVLLGTTTSGVVTATTISGDITINGAGVATIAANSVALGTDTSGDYVASLVAGTGVTLSNNSGESATPTIAIGQAVATSSSVTFAAVTVSGNLTVNGTTTTVNSTTVTIDDPIFTLGGDTAPSADDNKDRGIEFRYHSGTAASVGFMGYDDSSQWFTFLVGATNTNEVFSGTTASINVGGLYINGSLFSASNLSNGTTGSGSVVLATSPSISGGTHTGLTSLGIRDTSAAFDVTLAAVSSAALTVGRTLTLDVVNNSRTIKLAGNIDIGGNLTTVAGFATAGAFGITLTATNTTALTLPTTGTLSTLGGSETFTNKTLTSASLQTATVVSGSTAISGSVGFDASASVTLPAKTFFPEEYLSVSSSVTLNSTTHRYATLEMTASAGTSVITVPADASDNFAVGSVIQIIRVGAGEVQVTASAGVTVNNALGSRLRAQWSTATLRKRAANTWLLSGDLKV